MDIPVFNAVPPEQKFEMLGKAIDQMSRRINTLVLQNDEMRARIDELEAREKAKR